MRLTSVWVTEQGEMTIQDSCIGQSRPIGTRAYKIRLIALQETVAVCYQVARVIFWIVMCIAMWELLRLGE